MASNTNKNQSISRPPVVVVMGHVNHGKTSLLDYVRKANIAGREEGGITQSVGAYEVEANGKKITFIDTPGHEAFSKMRTRGAIVADIAILVVASDEGLKPQTKEAIKILKDTQTPFVVAITKIDKNNSDIDRVKNELAAEEVMLEGMGGDVSFQGVSVKTGEGIDDLLSTIVLLGEIEELKYNPGTPARGMVIESHKDNRRGVVASLIIKEGTLHEGDEIATLSTFGQVKILENFLGKRSKELVPSAPCQVVGFEKLPKVGEEFWVGKPDEIELAKLEKVEKIRTKKGESRKINAILKADTSGSLEVLKQVTSHLVEVIDASVGNATAADVQNAVTTKSIILSFGAGIDKAAENQAQIHKVQIFKSGIIYELVKLLEDAVKRESGGLPSGELEVLKVFDNKAGHQLVGGRVMSGVLHAKANVEVFRGTEKLGMVRLASLRSKKVDMPEIAAPSECGMLVDGDFKIQEGDIFKAFK